MCDYAPCSTTGDAPSPGRLLTLCVPVPPSPGANPDHAGLPGHATGRLPDHHEAGGLVGLLQGRGAALGPPDPLHHDEIRLLRAHRRGPLPVSDTAMMVVVVVGGRWGA